MTKRKFHRAKPIEIYASACQFTFATRYAASQSPPMVFALITNCCLSIELLLKTIIALENNDDFPEDHSLFRLFQRLESDTKANIVKRWDTYCTFPPHQQMTNFYENDTGLKVDLRLSKCLIESENAFVRFRYAFEKNGKPLPPFFLSGLELVLTDHILSRKPEFVEKHPRISD